MRDLAFKIHGKFPYILDDMINIKKYFKNNSVDAVFAVYSLYHLPDEDLKKLLSDIYDVLKVSGVFLFSYQIGFGEDFVDEPYLDEKGKNALYVSYQTDNNIDSYLDISKYIEIFKKEKIETIDEAVNSNNTVTSYRLVKKNKIRKRVFYK